MARSSKEHFNIALALAEQMGKTGNGEHAAAVARHLAGFKGVPKDYQVRLDAHLKELQSGKLPSKPAPSPETPTPVGPPARRSISEWIRKAFSAFTARR